MRSFKMPFVPAIISLMPSLVLAAAVAANSGYFRKMDPESNAHIVKLTSNKPPYITDIQSTGYNNGTFLNPFGPWFAYCSSAGCLPGPHLLSGNVFIGTAQHDASSQESIVSVSSTDSAGVATRWAPATSYPTPGFKIGMEVHNLGDNNVYKLIRPGISAATGTGPSGTDLHITDGGAVWSYVGAGLNDGKSGVSVSQLVTETGGQAWALNSAIVVKPGPPGISFYGLEDDTQNDRQDYPIGGPLFVGLFQYGARMTYPGTAARVVSIGEANSYAWHDGDLFLGDRVVQNDTIADATSSNVVFHALGGTHTHESVFEDDSNSNRSIVVQGKHGVGLDLSGGSFKTAIALPNDSAVSFGSYILRFGYKGVVEFQSYGDDGARTLLSVDGNGNSKSLGSVEAEYFTEKLSTPASSAAPCAAGQFTDDSHFHYVCVASNTWKRVALSTF